MWRAGPASQSVIRQEPRVTRQEAGRAAAGQTVVRADLIMSGVGETIASMLSRLDLDRYAGVFEEEAITHTALLASMGELLQDNLEELGLDAVAIAAVVEDLFPTEVNGRALPANPESAPQHSVAGPSIRGPQPELQVTQEEMEENQDFVIQ